MATYPAPDNRGNPIFNPIQYHTIGTSGQDTQGTGITQAEADARYLFLGSTQGAEQFQYDIQVNKGASFNQTTAQPIPLTINNLGKTATLTIDAASNLNLTTNQFGTGLVVRDTANNVTLRPTNTGLSLTNYDTGTVTGLTCGVINCTDVNINGADLAQLGPTGTTQTFLNYNIFQGTNTSQVGTAPLTITNIDTNLYSSFYQDHNNQDQLTIQSNTALGGLTLRNSTGNSFTVYPAGANNAATFINPINVINNLGVTCGSLTLSNAGNSTALTTGVVGLSINDSVIVGGDLFLTVGANTTTLSTDATGLIISDPVTATSLTLSSGGNTSAITTTASGLVVSDPVTANSLTLSSGGNTTTLTTTGTGLSVNDSITTLNTVNCGTLTASSFINTQTGDLFVGGESTFAKNSNIAGTTISGAGLYIGRNLEVGQAEFDIIAINPTSTNYLNIYGSQSSISIADTPIISIANNTAYKNGNEIATVNQIPSVPATYFTGQIVMSLASNPPTASGGTFLLCNGTAYSSTTYPNLFAIIGTAYGASTGGGFLPNLVAKFPYGANNASAVPYANSSGSVSGGANTYSLTQVPPHTHSNSVSNTAFYNGTSQAGNDSSNNYVVNKNSSTTTVTNNAGDNISATAITIPTVPAYIVVSYFIFAN
jgi:hypothetical protein